MIEEKQMKTVKVVAAIICDDIKEKNKIFATARRLWRTERWLGISRRKSGAGRNIAAGTYKRNHRRTGYGNQGRRTD